MNFRTVVNNSFMRGTPPFMRGRDSAKNLFHKIVIKEKYNLLLAVILLRQMKFQLFSFLSPNIIVKV